MTDLVELKPQTVKLAQSALSDPIFAKADDKHWRAVDSAIYRMQNSEIARCYLQLVASISKIEEELRVAREALEPFASLFDQRWAEYPGAPDTAPLSIGFALHPAKRTGDLELSDFRKASRAFPIRHLNNHSKV